MKWLQLAQLILLIFLQQCQCQELCGVCQHGIACVSETEFQRCENGIPDNSTTYGCNHNFVCTSDTNYCQDPAAVGVEPICHTVTTTTTPMPTPTPPKIPQYCNVCGRQDPTYDNGYSFACVGLNYYENCENGTISTSYSFACPEGTVCNIHVFEMNGNLCVPQCVVDFYNFPPTCNITDDELKRLCLNFESRPNFECFNIDNPYDDNCQSYIRCGRRNNEIYGYVKNCENGLYYDSSKNECLTTRPATCG